MEVAVVNILKVKDTGHTLLQGLAKEQVALGGRSKESGTRLRVNYI